MNNNQPNGVGVTYKDPKPVYYAIFEWRGDGRYEARDAVDGKLHKNRFHTQKLCDKLYQAGREVVVRRSDAFFMHGVTVDNNGNITKA